MKILFVGDVFGESGRRCVEHLVPKLRAEYELDAVFVNGENAARGIGITERQAKGMFRAGVDGITLGNHALRERDIFPLLEQRDAPIIRPANLASRAPGRGIMYVTVSDAATGSDVEIAVINLMGAITLNVAHAPFEIIDELINEARARTPVVLVDFHAEATSEKVALGIYLTGRASAVVGTHTHVQTSDARVLDKKTAYITDLGMTGPHQNSVIGVRSDIIVRRFLSDIGERFVPATEGVQLEGVVIELDPLSGHATSIEALRIPFTA